jgi:hypothetical protein
VTFYLSLTVTLVIALAIGVLAHWLRRAGGTRWWAGTALAVIVSAYFGLSALAIILDDSGASTPVRSWMATATFAVSAVFSAAGLRPPNLR